MPRIGIKFWALIVGAISFLFGLGGNGKAETLRKDSPKQSIKTEQKISPSAPQSSTPQIQFEPRPTDANQIVATYGAGSPNLGKFSQKGHWDYMPDGTLQQVDQDGNKILIRESGEVSIYDQGGRQTFKKVDPAAVQFFRTMKKSIEMREKTGN